jgi:hypothetical protein
MSTATQSVTGTHYEQLMKGVDSTVRDKVEDNLRFFANDADTSATAEKFRSDKLRNAYNALVDHLVSNFLNNLNPEQSTFLSTGAIGDKITIQTEKETKHIELLPTAFYESLLKSFSVRDPETIPAPAYCVVDKFLAIARNELVSFKMGKERERDLRNASGGDNSYVKNEWKRKMGQLRAEIGICVGQMENNFTRFIPSFNEAAGKNAKGAMDILKKVSTIWSRGDAATEQELAFLKAFEGKTGLAGGGMAKWLDELQTQMAVIAEHSKQVEEKYQVVLKCQQEIAKAEVMMKTSPVDGQKIRDEWKRKMDQVKGEVVLSIGQIDANSPKVVAALNAAFGQSAKVAMDTFRNIAVVWTKGDSLSDQEKAQLKMTETKIGSSAAELTKIVTPIMPLMAKISENGKAVEEKFQSVLKCKQEIDNADSGLVSVAPPSSGPLFEQVVIQQIKVDIETTNNVCVKAADTSAMRVPFSASRILLSKHFSDQGDPMESLCTPPAVLAALEKILKIHTNLFNRDWEGKHIIPPIMIDPIRNFVDFFEDRFVMSFVSGETVRKGAFVTFNPLEVQMLRLCALYLTKDPIYDYRGEVRTGTFMGDYMGKVEKSTKVKWTGQDKKFSLAASQSTLDEASRDDAISDYIDFISSIANNIAPSPKISKRRISILLRYVLFDRVEKNVAAILKLVTQTDPGEAKTAIMSFAKDNVDVAKDLVREAVKFDPMASKMFSDNADFAITRVFGGAGR